MVPTPRS
jgi:hypothetical protein